MRFAVMLYAFAGVSSRKVGKVMQLAGLFWNGLSGKSPSHVTVLQWVEKCGLALAKGSLRDMSAGEAYSLIYDNSITVCGQELHMELKAPAGHPGHSLGRADVEVAAMKVGQGWDSRMVREQIERTIDAGGRAPDYLLSDNGRVMRKAGRELGIPHHRDISHTFGIILEYVYSKEPDFASFVTKKGYARKFSHTPMAALMPPKRREYSRFMNAFDTVRWAKSVLDNGHVLTADERRLLGFVAGHASLIDELDCVMKAYEHMERLCKQKGLSRETADECRRHIRASLMTQGDRVRRLADRLIDYFDTEERLLKPGETHNISSDIIESTFGMLKERMSPNRNNGYTTIVLMLPTALKLSSIDECRKFSVTKILDNCTINDVRQWREKNLLQNPSNRRRKLTKKAGTIMPLS